MQIAVTGFLLLSTGDRCCCSNRDWIRNTSPLHVLLSLCPVSLFSQYFSLVSLSESLYFRFFSFKSLPHSLLLPLSLCHIQIDNTSVGWSLGFMINATNIIPPLPAWKLQTQKSELLSEPAYIGLLAIMSVLLLICLILATSFYRARRPGSYQPLASRTDDSGYGAV